MTTHNRLPELWNLLQEAERNLDYAKRHTGFLESQSRITAAKALRDRAQQFYNAELVRRIDFISSVPIGPARDANTARAC